MEDGEPRNPAALLYEYFTYLRETQQVSGSVSGSTVRGDEASDPLEFWGVQDLALSYVQDLRKILEYRSQREPKYKAYLDRYLADWYRGIYSYWLPWNSALNVSPAHILPAEAYTALEHLSLALDYAPRYAMSDEARKAVLEALEEALVKVTALEDRLEDKEAVEFSLHALRTAIRLFEKPSGTILPNDAVAVSANAQLGLIRLYASAPENSSEKKTLESVTGSVSQVLHNVWSIFWDGGRISAVGVLGWNLIVTSMGHPELVNHELTDQLIELAKAAKEISG